MAIRDDFTAGEVLAAADLNDTFGSKIPYAYGTATPSTTVDGFVWYDENETPPTAKFWDGAAWVAAGTAPGLTFIAGSTFSAVSSVSFNDLFSATYDNYIMWARVAGSTTLTPFLYRMRSSGSDDTTSNYDSQIFTSSSSTNSGSRATNATSGRIAAVKGSDWSGMQANIYAPFLAVPTIMTSESITAAVSSVTLENNCNSHDVSSSFDGITFFPNSGTITGEIRIYGIKNS
jgi:hypothetical protein